MLYIHLAIVSGAVFFQPNKSQDWAHTMPRGISEESHSKLVKQSKAKFFALFLVCRPVKVVIIQ